MAPAARSTDPPSRARLAASFDAAADVYARARPSYPDAAIDWLLPAGATRVLDLGAGTGKLTTRLVERGLEVVAVEPSERMRAQLVAALGDRVAAHPGSAEAIPLPDGSVDAVLVAQAWHWVDPARAVPEVARVLRPGGRLGLLWNRRDDSVPWVAALSEIVASNATSDGADTTARPHRHELGPAPQFTSPERFTTPPWSERATPEGIVELVASRSYVITLDPAARKVLLDRVRELLVHHPGLLGRSEIALPYTTDCVRCQLR